jgi:hypothetical protein
VKYPTVPIDTVRALFKNPGLVRALTYRPSMRTRVNREIEALSGAELDAVGRLLDDPAAPFPAEMSDVSRARALDLTSDIVDMRDPDAALLDQDPKLASLQQQLLQRRAALAVAMEPPPVRVPEDKMPHVGHATARVSLATGDAPDVGGAFYEIGGRVALHDLADAPDGYPETSAIEFLPTRLRFYPKPRSFELEDLWIVRVAALSPWRRFQSPLSFEVKAGATRLRDAGCFDCIAGDAEVSGGVTLGFGRGDPFAIYAMGDVAATYAPQLHGLAASTFRAGIGPLAGFRWRIARTLVWTADGGVSYLPDASPGVTWNVETTARWEFAPNFASGIDLRRWPLATEGSLTAYFYY